MTEPEDRPGGRRNTELQRPNIMAALNESPGIYAPFEMSYGAPVDLYSALNQNREAVARLGLAEAISRLFRVVNSESGPVPTQTIRTVILWASLRMPHTAVALMKLGADPEFVIDTYIDHGVTDHTIYALLISGTPLEWALKIVAERELDKSDSD